MAGAAVKAFTIRIISAAVVGSAVVITTTPALSQDNKLTPVVSAPSNQSSASLQTAPNLNMGEFYFFNTAGVGFFTSRNQSGDLPADLKQPSGSLDSIFFGVGVPNRTSGYWRMPSGYYYPWCPAVYSPHTVYPVPRPIYRLDEGSIKEANPPIKTISADLREFLDDEYEKQQLSKSVHTHLTSRLNVILSKLPGKDLRPEDRDVTEISNPAKDNEQSTARDKPASGRPPQAHDQPEVRHQLDLLFAEVSRALPF
jgi:hypothetical protein